MKNSFYHSMLVLVAIFIITTGCEKGTTTSEGKKSSGNEKPISAVGNKLLVGALMVEVSEPGAAENNEGVGHYKEGHWKTSLKHFEEAVAAGPKLAEAHYNMALTLDKLGDHGGATKHFGDALKLAPDNPKIKDSKILKDHLGM
jgi:tetratricopeptide (TPR) repeat protein